MFERFTEGARMAVVFAQEEARILRHDYIGVEHLLLGVLRADAGLLDVDVTAVRDRLRLGPGGDARQGRPRRRPPARARARRRDRATTAPGRLTPRDAGRRAAIGFLTS